MAMLLKHIFGNRLEQQAAQGPSQGTDALGAAEQLGGLEHLVGITGGEKTPMSPRDTDMAGAGNSHLIPETRQH